MVEFPHYLMGEADVFIGRRKRFRRYLVCSMEGYFPVLVRTGENALAVVFRVGAPHIGITGTLALSTSQDGGKSWSDPQELFPRWDDNRNPAFGVTRSGRLLLAFWKARLHAYKADPSGRGLYYRAQEEDQELWEKVPALYYCFNEDGGKTWSEPLPYSSQLLSLASPYGRILQAPDGTLLMGVYGRPRQAKEGQRYASILLRSRDGGQTWGEESLVAFGYNETAFAFLPDGRLLAAARSESGHVAILSSEDGGYSWSSPAPLTRDGEHPADLTVLQSGRVLLSFGRRIRPLGCGALLSEDGGRTWRMDREVLLAGDGIENTDVGYPSTVQLADGHIVTVLYYASGSEMSQGWGGWGRVSCQAIHYWERDIL
ncbi:MAG: exo-alpha-sialidase [Anaerolineae bacterium]|nr:exo-alpha-sialidase [Anaerolineae bacterium]